LIGLAGSSTRRLDIFSSTSLTSGQSETKEYFGIF